MWCEALTIKDQLNTSQGETLRSHWSISGLPCSNFGEYAPGRTFLPKAVFHRVFNGSSKIMESEWESLILLCLTGSWCRVFCPALLEITCGVVYIDAFQRQSFVLVTVVEMINGHKHRWSSSGRDQSVFVFSRMTSGNRSSKKEWKTLYLSLLSLVDLPSTVIATHVCSSFRVCCDRSGLSISPPAFNTPLGIRCCRLWSTLTSLSVLGTSLRSDSCLSTLR